VSGDLNEVSYKLGTINGKLDQLLAAMAAHIAADDKKHAEADAKIAANDARTDSLERSRAWTFGASAAIGFVITAIGGFLK
jgi:hypothetical protein